MRSSLSFCNRTVLVKNVRRFAPLWAMYLAAMLLIGPVMLSRQYFDGSVYSRVQDAAEYMEALVYSGWFFSFFYALLCAVMCFKYLHSTRSAYMLHALPVDRSTYYCTNVLTGLLFALVPMLLSVLLCLALLLMFGVSNAFGLALGLLLQWALQYLCFFGIAVFCMMLTGRTVIGVLTYLAVCGIGTVLPLLICNTIEPLFYGFTFEPETFLHFSPILHVFESKAVSVTAPQPLVWVYAAIGAALLVLGWLHYRRRHIERVGDAMIYGWAKIVFLVLFTALCAFTIGWILWMIFSDFDEDAICRMYLPFLLCLWAGCFVGWFGAQMMLKRSVRVFEKRNWLGFGIAAAVLCVFVLSLQRRVPAKDSVESVEVSAGWWEKRVSPETEAQLEKVLQIHRALVECRPDWAEGDTSDYWSDGLSFSRVSITYRLKNGLTVRRRYEIPDTDAGADASQLLTELYRDSQVCAAYYRELTLRLRKTASATLLEYRTKDDDTDREAVLQVSMEQLYTALVSDAREGRLPILTELSYEKSLPDESVEQYRIYFYDAADEDHYRSPYAVSFEQLEVPATAAQTLACFGINN